jgi:hypothetical protein
LAAAPPPAVSLVTLADLAFPSSHKSYLGFAINTVGST